MTYSYDLGMSKKSYYGYERPEEESFSMGKNKISSADDSIFNNNSLTLPKSQDLSPSIGLGNSTGALTLPQVQNDFSSANMLNQAGALTLPQGNVQPEESSSLTSELMGGGVFMGGMAIIPKALTWKDSMEAIKSTSELVDKGARGASMAEAAKTATLYGNVFESYRLENSIKAASRAEFQTNLMLSKLKQLRESYNAAVKAGDTVLAAKYAAEMKTFIDAAKKPSWFARLFSKLKFWSKTEPKAAQSLAEISTSMTKAGKEAAAAAEAVKLSKDASKLTNAANWVKDANKTHGFKAMWCIEALIEGFTEVLPAFMQGGASEGGKQLVKSAVNVTASATGWCVGAKAGAWAGAAIGSFICPGIGTAIGGAIGGILGGVLGSWGAKKIAKVATGDSFTEASTKNAQAQAQMQAQAQSQIQSQTQTQAQAGGLQSLPSETAEQTIARLNIDKKALSEKYINGTATAEEKALSEKLYEEAKAKAFEGIGNIDFSRYNSGYVFA